MHKPILALAALVAATGYFVDSLGTANAEFSDPVISGGESPWVSFSGDPTLLLGESFTVYTVPSDQALVITGVKMGTGAADLYEGETMRIDGGTEAMTIGFLAHGNGHISFSPGSLVRLVNPDVGTLRPTYLISGYLTHP